MNAPVPPRSADVRPPACAGRFYPALPGHLRSEIRRYLAAAPQAPPIRPKAVIVPHAGYVYSGAIAATAYAQVGHVRDAIRRVVLLGPSHHADFRGLGASPDGAFDTPLGQVPVDVETVGELVGSLEVEYQPAAHAPEHCLEVQLPFLQCTLADFRIVPLLVGRAEDSQIAQVLDRLWDGEETLVLVSSDLSHYYDYAAAARLDRATARIIQDLRGEELGSDQACGVRPIRGLLATARRFGLICHTLDVRNSGDTAGPRDRVVGYGAFAFAPAA